MDPIDPPDEEFEPTSPRWVMHPIVWPKKVVNIQRARNLLLRHGSHDSGCSFFRTRKCSCGYSAALEELTPPPTDKEAT
jgi:hypothetical protein